MWAARLVDPKIWKLILTTIVVVLLVINFLSNPANLVTDFQDKIEPDAKAAAFALITALAAFISFLPNGRGLLAGFSQLYARLTTAAGAVLAGAFWLSAATGENLDTYLVAISLIAGLIGLVLIGLGGYLFAIIFFGFLLWQILVTLCRLIAASGRLIVAIFNRIRKPVPLIKQQCPIRFADFFANNNPIPFQGAGALLSLSPATPPLTPPLSCPALPLSTCNSLTFGTTYPTFGAKPGRR